MKKIILFMLLFIIVVTNSQITFHGKNNINFLQKCTYQCTLSTKTPDIYTVFICWNTGMQLNYIQSLELDTLEYQVAYKTKIDTIIEKTKDTTICGVPPCTLWLYDYKTEYRIRNKFKNIKYTKSDLDKLKTNISLKNKEKISLLDEKTYLEAKKRKLQYFFTTYIDSEIILRMEFEKLNKIDNGKFGFLIYNSKNELIFKNY